MHSTTPAAHNQSRCKGDASVQARLHAGTRSKLVWGHATGNASQPQASPRSQEPRLDRYAPTNAASVTACQGSGIPKS